MKCSTTSLLDCEKQQFPWRCHDNTSTRLRTASQTDLTKIGQSETGLVPVSSENWIRGVLCHELVQATAGSTEELSRRRVVVAAY
jgi:hypothetical protein